MSGYEAEARWRRDVMGEAKEALACGDTRAAYEALTRHEQGGYPWAPGATSNMGPDVARDDIEEGPRRAVEYVASTRKWVPRSWWPEWVKELREGFRR